MKRFKRGLRAVVILLLLFVLTLCAAGCADAAGKKNSTQQTSAAQENTAGKKNKNTGDKGSEGKKKKWLYEEEAYYSKDDVARYIHLFRHLPDNYIKKSKARDLGWVSSKGNLWDVAPGCVIGGDYFGNREGTLPEKKGRKFFECDVNYEGGYRGEERLIYTNDGLVYYTDDHYNRFELLYGEE